MNFGGMEMDTNNLGTFIVTGVTSVLGGGAFVNWLKDRKKDDAAAVLTNVEALQKQVILLTNITEYLRKENSQLALDREQSDQRSRQLTQRLREVEKELSIVQETANNAQQQVAALSIKIRRITSGDTR